MRPQLIQKVSRVRALSLGALGGRRSGGAAAGASPLSFLARRPTLQSLPTAHANWSGRAPLVAYLSTVPRWEEPSEQVTRPPVMPRPKAKSELAVQPQEPAAPVAEESKRLSVVAYYVGQKVDLFAIVQTNFVNQRGYKISDDLLLVPLGYEEEDRGIMRSAMVVFKHGSVVFFNVNEKEQTEYLRAVTRHCGEVVAQTHRFRETLECRLRPGQEKYHEMGQDVVNLRELSEDMIKVISDVIGHSVALNFYNQKADGVLDRFRTLNNSVEGSGIFTEMDKKGLFKLVAQNNKILTDAMSSGLLEQSKPAWNSNRLDKLWGDLRHEFSIGDRFNKVEHKINHVHSNTKFFLEILNHQKSNKLEWIIIVLISAECVLSCVDLYHQLFRGA